MNNEHKLFVVQEFEDKTTKDLGWFICLDNNGDRVWYLDQKTGLSFDHDHIECKFEWRPLKIK